MRKFSLQPVQNGSEQEENICQYFFREYVIQYVEYGLYSENVFDPEIANKWIIQHLYFDWVMKQTQILYFKTETDQPKLLWTGVVNQNYTINIKHSASGLWIINLYSYNSNAAVMSSDDHINS